MVTALPMFADSFEGIATVFHPSQKFEPGGAAAVSAQFIPSIIPVTPSRTLFHPP
jgi:hypothetical protein